MRRSRTRSALYALATIAAAVAALGAGPLNPPAGPVTSTAKPLSDIEPRIAINAANTPGNAGALYRITQPGSYYLTGDVTGAPSKVGISISASNVRIDLNGYSLRGVDTSSAGIASSLNNLTNIEIVNGTITGWGGSGIDLSFFGVPSSAVRNVRCMLNGGHGIALWYNGRVEGCTALSNSVNGIDCGNNSMVVQCQTNQNSGHGVNVLSQSVIERCVADANSGDGIKTGLNCTLTGCVASGNTANGLELGAGTRACQCNASENDSYGVIMGQGCSLTDSTARANATSAVRITGASATLSKCTLEGVGGFPVIAVDAVSSVRIADNEITAGTYAIAAPSVPAALVTGNHCVLQTTGAFTLHANAQAGTAISAGGAIGAVSPFANFVH